MNNKTYGVSTSRKQNSARLASTIKDFQLAIQYNETTKKVSNHIPNASVRYSNVSERKTSGATYTPVDLARYLAEQLVQEAEPFLKYKHLNIFDPALGSGVLVEALLRVLKSKTEATIHVTAYETDEVAIRQATALLGQQPKVDLEIVHGDFLQAIKNNTLNNKSLHNKFDLAIANPPYVRTQILGADESRSLANRFGLEGRLDLYHAFLLGMVDVLKENGKLGVITSNRFMTTRGASALRNILQKRLELHRVWDLGDTKIFDAAVLPALILGSRSSNSDTKNKLIPFTSVYETSSKSTSVKANNIISVLDKEGTFSIPDGKTFHVQQGTLNAGSGPRDVWRLSTSKVRSWLDRVSEHTWAQLQILGRIRVGVKTTADKIFIRKDWNAFSEDERPELLRPLITHHVGMRYRAMTPTMQILYPHLVKNGHRVVADLNDYPKTATYLKKYRAALEARTYVIESGRQWYEIWVPQDPDAWSRPKLVFRDICKRPTFWIDISGGIVNGDCYWLTCEDSSKYELLWLAAAVCNSTFIEQFYDKRFNNKLYAGRRRFITQYVEQFPLPDPDTSTGRELIRLAKKRWKLDGDSGCHELEVKIDQLVWNAFGFTEST